MIEFYRREFQWTMRGLFVLTHLMEMYHAKVGHCDFHRDNVAGCHRTTGLLAKNSAGPDEVKTEWHRS